MSQKYADNDVKIEISSAAVGNDDFEPEHEISKSYDNDFNTMYHSRMNSPTLPVLLKYNFAQSTSKLDYIRYTPPNEAMKPTGRFKNVDLSVYSVNAENISCQNFALDFNESDRTSWFKCDPPILNPEGVSMSITSGSGGYASCVDMSFFHFPEVAADIFEIATDGDEKTLGTKIEIDGAKSEASSVHPGYEITNSLDGNRDTKYYSNWNEQNTCFPVTLTYRIKEKVPRLDYIIYRPRTIGWLGCFMEFDLLIATEEVPEFQKIGSYDFEAKGVTTCIKLRSPISNPTAVQFVVKSGIDGYVTVGEMEFYAIATELTEFAGLFTDLSCTQLKADVDEKYINENISDPLYQNLALRIYRGEDKQEREFRIQVCRAYTHPDLFANQNQTASLSVRDNPTGIWIKAGEDLVVCVDFFTGPLSVFVHDISTSFSGTEYRLRPGINRISVRTTGLMYVYYMDSALQAHRPPLRMHLMTGLVNGYFDIAKHGADDWSRLLNATTFPFFDVVGRYTHQTNRTSHFKDNTSDGMALVKALDELVYLEWDFMGYVKYNRMPGNRVYFIHYDTDEWILCASSYRICATTSNMYNLQDLRDVTVGSCWGPAHEVGHCNQVRPVFRWMGMIEVTNNIFSLHVQTSWGMRSRLHYDGVYDKAFTTLLNKNIAHNSHDDVFVKLVPFWQLKLYLVDALGQADFYKDLNYCMYTTREFPEDTNHGTYQLNFVKVACRIANLNLSKFFEAWGFLTPVEIPCPTWDIPVFTVAAEDVEKVRAEIGKYPLPAHDNIYDITDETVDQFKTK